MRERALQLWHLPSVAFKRRSFREKKIECIVILLVSFRRLYIQNTIYVKPSWNRAQNGPKNSAEHGPNTERRTQNI